MDGEEEHSSDGALQAWGQRTVSKPTHTESCIANLCTLITAHFSAHPTLHGAHLKVQLHHTHHSTRLCHTLPVLKYNLHNMGGKTMQNMYSMHV